MASIKKRLTIEAVKSLEAGTTLWDTELPGLAVRCQSQAKVYGLKYRVDGRQRWYTIGHHGGVGPDGTPWTPETVRRAARKLLGMVADNKDPAATRQLEKSAPTVAELMERFLDEHVEAKRKARTAEEYRTTIERLIKPEIGHRKVRDITRADIARLHHKLKATPYQANRVLAILSKFFNLAEAWGERPDYSNPVRHIERFKEVRRERFLSPEELGALGQALRAAELTWGQAEDVRRDLAAANKEREAARTRKDRASMAEAEARAAVLRQRLDELGDLVSPDAIAAIRLLIFTGARLSEILTLKWEWVDMARGEARLPDSKTGAKTLHLPPPALEVLNNLPRIGGNPHVIVGQRAGQHLSNLGSPWQIVRKAAGLEGVRLHDLRHAFASIAASSGMGLPIIGKMLGHTQPATTARYAHLASDPVKAAAAAVAGTIHAAMNGREAEVVELPKRKV